jgi:hypothetical protein
MSDHLYVYRSVVMIFRYGKNKQFKSYLSEYLTFSFDDKIVDKCTHEFINVTPKGQLRLMGEPPPNKFKLSKL